MREKIKYSFASAMLFPALLEGLLTLIMCIRDNTFIFDIYHRTIKAVVGRGRVTDFNMSPPRNEILGVLSQRRTEL